MAWCSCSQSPFQTLFGRGDRGLSNELESGRKGHKLDLHAEDSIGSGYDPYKRQVRTGEEIESQISKWEPLLNPRIKELWPDGAKDTKFKKAMKELLLNTDARDDPVTNPYEHVCTLWYGDVAVDDNAAVLALEGANGETTLTYVVRLLAFMFADENTFNLLQQHGGEGPLPMSCDNVRCVNIKHCIIPE